MTGLEKVDRDVLREGNKANLFIREERAPVRLKLELCKTP